MKKLLAAVCAVAVVAAGAATAQAQTPSSDLEAPERIEVALEARLTSDGRAEFGVAWTRNGLPQHRQLPLRRFLRVVEHKEVGGRGQPTLCSTPVTLTYTGGSRVVAVCAQHYFHRSEPPGYSGYWSTRVGLVTGVQTASGIVWLDTPRIGGYRQGGVIFPGGRWPATLTRQWTQIEQPIALTSATPTLR